MITLNALALLQSQDTGGFFSNFGLVGGIIVFVVLLVVSFALFFAARYKRCPANRVLVVSGKVGNGRNARIISGGGALVLPVIQEYDYLPLDPIKVSVDLLDALSLENIRLAVPSVFTVAIGSTPEMQQNAATRLLGMDIEQIRSTAHDIIMGQLRQVIASMTIDQINRDRDSFRQKITEHLEPELAKFGISLLNVNVTDLKDQSGYIDALGKQAASAAVQKARGDVAEQERMGALRVAEAERDKAVGVANLSKEKDVGENEAQAQRDALMATAQQQRRVAVAAAEAEAVAGESQSQMKVATTQAELEVKKAEASQSVEIARRTADASVAEAQNRAQTKAALANAERVEAERRAELEAPAKAQAATVIVQAEAEARRKIIEAEAEAKANLARLTAQAQGEADILSKRAEALGVLVEKAGGADQAYKLLTVEQLPVLADKLALALSNIKIDKITVWEQNGSNGGSTSSLLKSIVGMMPPMMNTLQEIGAYRGPSVLGSAIAEADAKPLSVDTEATPSTPSTPFEAEA